MEESSSVRVELDLADFGHGNGSEHSDWWNGTCSGAMYVSFEDSVQLQKCLDNSGEISVTRPSSDPMPEVSLCFVPTWPREIVWAQRTNSYGATFPSIAPYVLQ